MFIVIMLVCLIYILSSMKVDGASKKCHTGALLMVLGMIVGAAIEVVPETLRVDAGFLVGYIAIIFFLLTAGAVVGVIGLAEYRSRLYTSGKKLVISFMVVSAGYILLNAAICFSKIKNKWLEGIEYESENIGSSDKFISDKQYNFQFSHPGKQYRAINLKKVNKLARYSYVSTDPTVFVIIMPTIPGIEDSTTLDAYTEASRSTLNPNVIPIRKVEFNGLAWQNYSTLAKVNGTEFYYNNWLAIANGALLQICFYSDDGNHKAVDREAERIMHSFSLLDENRILHAQGYGDFGRYVSDQTGVVADLTGMEWGRELGAMKSSPYALFCARGTSNQFFDLVPIFLKENEISLEALTQIVLKKWSYDYPDKRIENYRKIEFQGYKGCEFEYPATENEGKTRGIFRIVRKGGQAYGLLYKAEEGMGDPVVQAHALFDRVILPPEVKFTLKELPEAMQKEHAKTLNSAGLFYYSVKEYARAGEFFRRAYSYNPADPLMLKNVLDVYNNQNNYQQGLDYLTQKGGKHREDNDFRMWEAWFKSALGEDEAALSVYKKTFSGDYRADSDFYVYIDVLGRCNMWQEALDEIIKYEKKCDDVSLSLKKAWVWERMGENAKAVEFLKPLKQKHPFNTSISFALMRNYDDMKQYQDSLAIADRMIEQGAELGLVYYFKGRSLYYLKWYRKSKIALEKSLKHNPDDNDAKELLRYVSGLLGEGKNSSIKEAIAPVDLPTPVEVHMQDAQKAKISAKDGLWCYYKILSLHYQKGESVRITERIKVKVLDQVGVSTISTLSRSFNPLEESVYVNSLKVFDENGTLVSEGNADEYYVVDKKGEMATHDQLLNIPVSGVQPGAVVELVLTRKKIGKNDCVPYDYYTFITHSPVKFYAVTFNGDLSTLASHAINGLVEKEYENGRLWYADASEAYIDEPKLARLTEFVAHLYLGDKNQNWQDVSAEYSKRLSGCLVSSAQTKEIALKVTSGCNNNLEKCQRLLEYIRSNYTYKAIEFGVRGVNPNQPDKTIANKYGDCKDFAVLYVQLLKECGIDADLVLAKTGESVYDGIASLNQFDHMITKVNGVDGCRYVDPTNRGLEFGVSIPSGLGGNSVLVLNQVKPHMEKFPVYSEDSSRIIIGRDIRPHGKEGLLITDSLRLKGYYASFLRNYLIEETQDKRESWARDVLNMYCRGGRIKEVTFAGIDDMSKELEVMLCYVVPSSIRYDEHGCSIRYPAVWVPWYVESEMLKETKFPFSVSYPYQLDCNVSLTLPEGYKVSQYYLDSKNYDGNALCWHEKDNAEKKENILKINLTLKNVAGVFRAQDYAKYCEQSRKAVKAVSGEVRCLQIGRAQELSAN